MYKDNEASFFVEKSQADDARASYMSQDTTASEANDKSTEAEVAINIFKGILYQRWSIQNTYIESEHRQIVWNRLENWHNNLGFKMFVVN